MWEWVMSKTSEAFGHHALITRLNIDDLNYLVRKETLKHFLMMGLIMIIMFLLKYFVEKMS